jgi:hypothetical protein
VSAAPPTLAVVTLTLLETTTFGAVCDARSHSAASSVLDVVVAWLQENVVLLVSALQLMVLAVRLVVDMFATATDDANKVALLVLYVNCATSALCAAHVLPDKVVLDTSPPHTVLFAMITLLVLC